MFDFLARLIVARIDFTAERCRVRMTQGRRAEQSRMADANLLAALNGYMIQPAAWCMALSGAVPMRWPLVHYRQRLDI